MQARHNTYALAVAGLLCVCIAASAQGPAKPEDRARAIVSAAVQKELESDRDDHTPFAYRDHDVTPDHDTVYLVVETPQGDLKRKLEDHGHAIGEQEQATDEQHLQALATNPAEIQKQRANEHHDNDQAEQMLRLLPEEYLWTIRNETPEEVTLTFRPDPAFQPGNMEARVLSAMAGEMVIARQQNRIYALHGALTADVKIGFGVLGRLKQGGTFQIDRREVAPGHWQVVESHVHIIGHALFFKTIGSQEDEVKTDFHISPAATLSQAVGLLDKK